MFKRAFDIIVSLSALLLLAVPLLLIALWIRFDSPGPALFRQVRVGRHGRPFRIHKFRTMTDVPNAGASLLTAAHDSRITPAGRWLRDRRIDELPQLIDVLLGHMSLVGPRPEVPQFVAHYPPELKATILAVRPGITDPAALAFRDEARLLAQAADAEQAYIRTILPTKLRLQADHIATASFLGDVAVLIRTLRVLWKGRA